MENRSSGTVTVKDSGKTLYFEKSQFCGMMSRILGQMQSDDADFRPIRDRVAVYLCRRSPIRKVSASFIAAPRGWAMSAALEPMSPNDLTNERLTAFSMT